MAEQHLWCVCVSDRALGQGGASVACGQRGRVGGADPSGSRREDALEGTLGNTPSPQHVMESQAVNCLQVQEELRNREDGSGTVGRFSTGLAALPLPPGEEITLISHILTCLELFSKA